MWLGLGGIGLLIYGGYAVVQGTGALVWFVPRLNAGALVVAALGLPWMCGGALLLAAGATALRDAVTRRVPTRRWLGTLATGTVLAAAPGLLWWGWLPFAWLGPGSLDLLAAGGLIHTQFASAVLAALLYLVWSRRLPHAAAHFGATAGRLALVTAACGLVAALWMHEGEPASPVVHNGKTALEWAKQCHSDVEREDITAWEALKDMGADGEPGWTWLLERESGLGGRFASVWVSWLLPQREVVGWYDDLLLDDGLALPALFEVRKVQAPSEGLITALREAMQESRWALPARDAWREGAAFALASLGPAARPAFHDLLDHCLWDSGGIGAVLDPKREQLFGLLGRVGIEANDPRRLEALQRLRGLYQGGGLWRAVAARVVVEIDPAGAAGADAMRLLISWSTECGPEQSLACEQLETLGPRARAAVPALAASLIEHIDKLHPPFEFLNPLPHLSEYDARAVWRALLCVATPAQMTPVLLAALQHEGRGPRLTASRAIAEGEVEGAALFTQLWQVVRSGREDERAAGAWAIAVQQNVPDHRLAELVPVVDWPAVEALLPQLSSAQRDRVTGLLERAVTHSQPAVAAAGAKWYAEFHERSQELQVEESGADK